MLKYPAKITNAKEGGYLVEFPDLDIMTEGETLKEAKEMAQDALTGFILASYDINKEIPNPSKLEGENIYYIAPESEVALPLLIKQLRLQKGLSQKQVSEAIGIKYQTYQRFENPATFNATIKTLKRIGHVLGKELIIEFC